MRDEAHFRCLSLPLAFRLNPQLPSRALEAIQCSNAEPARPSGQAANHESDSAGSVGLKFERRWPVVHPLCRLRRWIFT